MAGAGGEAQRPRTFSTIFTLRERGEELGRWHSSIRLIQERTRRCRAERAATFSSLTREAIFPSMRAFSTQSLRSSFSSDVARPALPSLHAPRRILASLASHNAAPLERVLHRLFLLLLFPSPSRRPRHPQSHSSFLVPPLPSLVSLDPRVPPSSAPLPSPLLPRFERNSRRNADGCLAADTEREEGDEEL